MVIDYILLCTPLCIEPINSSYLEQGKDAILNLTSLLLGVKFCCQHNLSQSPEP